MIYILIFSFLQLVTPTASEENTAVIVDDNSDKIHFRCSEGNITQSEDGPAHSSITLSYQDDQSGELLCVKGQNVMGRIFVKFRTCDNCIEMDLASVVGMVVGDAVATLVIGVGVYIVASTNRSASAPSNRKRSDGLPPTSHKGRGEPYDPYQRLRHKGSKDIYEDFTTGR